MKTAITIPWEAVVEGCPPSATAKALPLVESRHCSSRSQVPGAHYDWLSKVANTSSASSLAVGRRSGGSTLVELLLVGAEAEAVATLTTDRQTAVVVQSLRAPLGTLETFDSDLATDELVRTYVLRYARMDADVRAFVVPDADGGEHRDNADGRKPMQFMRPQNWGFGPLAATTTTAPTTTASWRTSHLPPSDGSHLVNCYCSSNAVLRPPHRNPFNEPPPDRGDPLHCLPPLMQVRAALESGLCSQTYEPHAESLCYWPVLALGRCRLFGVKIAEDQDFTPGPEVFAHASRRLRERVVAILESFADLDGRIERQGVYGHANLALELLEARMDAHAAYLALDEAYAAALYEGSPEVPAMSRRLTQVRRLINLFDGNLQKNLPLLRLAASTYLLDNWRRLLAPAYRDCPPWWLDGCIG